MTQPASRLFSSWARCSSASSALRVPALQLFENHSGLSALPVGSIASETVVRRGFNTCFFDGASRPILRDPLGSPLGAFRVRVAMKATVPRDPERPKRPLSSYMRFAAAQREKGMKQVSEIGAAWRSLSEHEKAPFEQAAASEKEVYAKKMDEYKASGKADAFKRDPAKPVRPMTAFFAWAQQERKSPSLAQLSVTAVSKELGSRWKVLPQEQKAPFEQQYKEEKERFDSQMEAYKASGSEAAWLERTGRMDIVKKAEAKRQAEKDKLKEDKMKKKAKAEKAKEAAKAKAQLLKEKKKLAMDKKKLAMDKKKAADRLAKEKAKEKAKVAAEKKKTKLAAEKEKAKLAAEKKKAKLAAEKKKAQEAARKQKEKAALAKKKALAQKAKSKK